ncbi:MAG: hypothetical protein J5483_06515, partial [Lachnospiraceae bacterium]|nr:hypothetical protein [Lachnospiraceae bacterium]
RDPICGNRIGILVLFAVRQQPIDSGKALERCTPEAYDKDNENHESAPLTVIREASLYENGGK